jgi:hypothetical protein
MWVNPEDATSGAIAASLLHHAPCLHDSQPKPAADFASLLYVVRGLWLLCHLII